MWEERKQMIKGVNRQVIEVCDTGNRYFERAWLVIRADCTDADSDQLHEEAKKLVSAAGCYSGLRLNQRRRWTRRILLTLSAGGVGTLLGLLLSGILR